MPTSSRSTSSFYLQILRFLSSIRFTVILLALTVCTVAIATWIESVEGSHEAASLWVYSHPLFTLMLGGYFINILFSALSRAPYRLRHLPFLITHLGLLLVLTGQFLKMHFGHQLQVFLPIGQKVDFGVAKKGYSLLLKERKPNSRSHSHLTQVDFDEKSLQSKPLIVDTPLSLIEIGSPKKISTSRTISSADDYQINSPFSNWLAAQWELKDRDQLPLSFTPLCFAQKLQQHEKQRALGTFPEETLESLEKQFIDKWRVWLQSSLHLHTASQKVPYTIDISLKRDALLHFFSSDPIRESDTTHLTQSHPTALSDLLETLTIYAQADQGEVICYDLLGKSVRLHQSFALVEKQNLHKFAFNGSYSCALIDESSEAGAYFFLLQQEPSKQQSEDFFEFQQLHISAGKIDLSDIPWVLSLDQGFSGTAIQIDPSAHLAKSAPSQLSRQLELRKEWEENITKGLDYELFPTLSKEKARELWKKALLKWPSSHSLWPDQNTFQSAEREDFLKLMKAFDLEHPQIQALLPIVEATHSLLSEAHLMDQKCWLVHLKDHKWPLISSHRNLEDPWQRLQLLLGQIQLAKALAGNSESALFLPKNTKASLEEKEKAFWGLMLLSNMHPQTFIKRELALAKTPSEHFLPSFFFPLSTAEGAKEDGDLFSIELSLPHASQKNRKRIALDRSPSPLMHPVQTGLESYELAATLTSKRQRLSGHELILLEAKETFYPNSLIPMSYDAALLIDGKKVSLSMNHVYETDRCWRFYLSSMQPKTAKNKTPTWVVLTASQDPFKNYTTYPGCILIATGAALLFWPRKKRGSSQTSI